MMDVSCPRCDAVYEFDPSQVRGGGVTLKCSQCEHLFRLEGAGQILDESQPRWMVRKDETGDVLYFAGFDTLHKWIMEGSIGGEDAISRTGLSWTRLQDIGEFTPIFQVVESIARLTASKTTPAVKPQTASYPLVDEEDEEPTAVARPRRAKQRTVPGRPGGGPSSETGPQTRPTPSGAMRQVPSRTEAVTAPARPSRTAVSETQRQEHAAATPEKSSEEWSLGELELAPEEFARRTRPAKKSKKSALPLVALLLVVALAALGFWQRDHLSALLEGTPKAGEEGQSQVEHSDPFAKAEAVVGGALYAGRRQVREAAAPFVLESMEQAQQAVAAAQIDAERDASRAARPPSVPELISAGRRSLDRGDGAGARRRFEQALAQAPNNGEALIGLGWAYLALNDVESAANRFQAALRRDPSAGEALIGLGRAERERNDPRAALAAYESYLERFPSGQHASIARFQSEQLRQALSAD